MTITDKLAFRAVIVTTFGNQVPLRLSLASFNCWSGPVRGWLCPTFINYKTPEVMTNHFLISRNVQPYRCVSCSQNCRPPPASSIGVYCMPADRAGKWWTLQPVKSLPVASETVSGHQKSPEYCLVDAQQLASKVWTGAEPTASLQKRLEESRRPRRRQDSQVFLDFLCNYSCLASCSRAKTVCWKSTIRIVNDLLNTFFY